LVILRGELWWADLPDAEGSAPAYRRPVLIIQSDVFNRSRIGTIIAAVLTSNLEQAEALGNVPLPQRITGLKRDSAVNVSQLSSLDRTQLTERIGRLPPSLMRVIDDGLRLVLNL
jgi:mRNA interferase MazF